ncbi:MAG: hypothetical protein R3C44_00470 [Chloroflexota bacterium]
MGDPQPEANGRSGFTNTQVIIALIGAAATILAAVLAGVFGLIGRSSPPASTPQPPAAGPSISIDGPVVAPLNQLTYFTLVSADAERAAWSIGGFNNNETVEIDPLSPSYQIQIEPNDESRVGDTFTLVVTVYDRTGASATATHTFQIVGDDG